MCFLFHISYINKHQKVANHKRAPLCDKISVRKPFHLHCMNNEKRRENSATRIRLGTWTVRQKDTVFRSWAGSVFVKIALRLCYTWQTLSLLRKINKKKPNRLFLLLFVNQRNEHWWAFSSSVRFNSLVNAQTHIRDILCAFISR